MSMASVLLELEKCDGGGKRQELLETIYRDAHSLKGASRTVGLNGIGQLCQEMESVFKALQKEQLEISSELIDEIQSGLKLIELESADGHESRTREVESLAERLQAIAAARANGDMRETTPEVHSKANVESETEDSPAESTANKGSGKQPASVRSADAVRIASDRLDSLLRRAEEMVTLKLHAASRTSQLRGLAAVCSEETRNESLLHAQLQTLRQHVARDGSPDISAGEIEFMADRIEHCSRRWKQLHKSLFEVLLAAEEDQRSTEGMVDGFLRELKQTAMLPFSSLFTLFPIMLRDIAREQKKEIELNTEGEDIEVDRRILDELRDVLTHLLRNAVDHGIEESEIRRKAGKPARGAILLKAQKKDQGRIRVVIEDDGCGADIDRIRAGAVEKGWMDKTAADKLSDEEVLGMILSSGFSTSSMITDISGRGLGMAIIQERIDRIGGSIAMTNSPGKGFRVEMDIPVALESFRGILAAVGDRSFAIPSNYVRSCLRLEQESIKRTENREFIHFADALVAIADLGAVLGLPPATRPDDQHLQIVVAEASGARMALKVSEVLGESVGLLKPLGPQLLRVRNIGSAIVLGSGEVVPVLNAHDLLKSAAGIETTAQTIRSPERERQKRLLVVEDSVTARMLLKNILESEGYEVSVANDGRAGYSKLREIRADLVVSDIEMPRMNGFEMTRKIRDDDEIAHTPVILVTGLSSREDRERGMEAGANAYIVKQEFDQSNLLDAVRSLI